MRQFWEHEWVLNIKWAWVNKNLTQVITQEWWISFHLPPRFRPTASSPPTTIAPPTTTSIFIPDRPIYEIQSKPNFDSPTLRQPDKNSIQFTDKDVKYQSNLNEIDKFEHKSQSDSSSKVYDWPPSTKDNSAESEYLKENWFKKKCSNLKEFRTYLCI